MEIRRLEYDPGAYVEYVYIPEENICVYSGVSNALHHATTAARVYSILLGISRKLVRHVQSIRFFELSTFREWPHLRPGTYDFKAVTFSRPTMQDGKKGIVIFGFSDVAWTSVPCPREIVKVFRAHIGNGLAAPQRYENSLADVHNPFQHLQ